MSRYDSEDNEHGFTMLGKTLDESMTRLSQLAYYLTELARNFEAVGNCKVAKDLQLIGDEMLECRNIVISSHRDAVDAELKKCLARTADILDKLIDTAEDDG